MNNIRSTRIRTNIKHINSPVIHSVSPIARKENSGRVLMGMIGNYINYMESRVLKPVGLGFRGREYRVFFFLTVWS